MQFQIVLDDTILIDLFKPSPVSSSQANRAERIRRHVLVGSKELIRIWKVVLEHPLFLESQFLKEHFGDWINGIIDDPTCYVSVSLPGNSLVQGNPSDKERVILETAYQSDSKLVIGDYPYELRQANPDLTFVSKDGFSEPRPRLITMQQIQEVLSQTGNLKNNWFLVFETPISLQVNNHSSDLLARYLSHFYDDKLIIQDKFFVESDQNENNFVQYILPHVDRETCNIKLRVMMRGSNATHREKSRQKKQRNEQRNGYSIQVDCIEESREDLHDGYIMSSKYRIDIPYRLNVFGSNGKTTSNRIKIDRV